MARTVVHFEIPADDVEAVAEFHRSPFGWRIEKTPMDYWLIGTAPEGQGLNGGMMKRQSPEHGPHNYIGVESVEEHSGKAEELGARVVAPKQAVPGVGVPSPRG